MVKFKGSFKIEYSPVALRHPPTGGGGGRAGTNMFYVYSVYNKKHNKIYIGQTEDLDQRVRLHNDKEFRNSYTARFDGEWVLVYKEELETRQDALKREKQSKSYRGRGFIKKLIYSPVAQR